MNFFFKYKKKKKFYYYDVKEYGQESRQKKMFYSRVLKTRL